jgi:hypothetical protein
MKSALNESREIGVRVPINKEFSSPLSCDRATSSELKKLISESAHESNDHSRLFVNHSFLVSRRPTCTPTSRQTDFA